MAQDTAEQKWLFIGGCYTTPTSLCGLELGKVKMSAFHRSVEERGLRVQQPGLPESKPQYGWVCPPGPGTAAALCGKATPWILGQEGPGMGALQAGARTEEPTAGHYVLSGQCASSRPRQVTSGPGVISSQLSENASSTAEGHGPLLDQRTPKGGLRAPRSRGP